MSDQPHRNLSKAVRCPKCRSRQLKLEEYSPGSVTTYTQSYNGAYRIHQEHTDSKSTSDLNIRATCGECLHVWTVRGVRKISELNYAAITGAAGKSAPAP